MMNLWPSTENSVSIIPVQLGLECYNNEDTIEEMRRTSGLHTRSEHILVSGLVVGRGHSQNVVHVILGRVVELVFGAAIIS